MLDAVLREQSKGTEGSDDNGKRLKNKACDEISIFHAELCRQKTFAMNRKFVKAINYFRMRIFP